MKSSLLPAPCVTFTQCTVHRAQHHKPRTTLPITAARPINGAAVILASLAEDASAPALLADVVEASLLVVAWLPPPLPEASVRGTWVPAVQLLGALGPAFTPKLGSPSQQTKFDAEKSLLSPD